MQQNSSLEELEPRKKLGSMHFIRTVFFLKRIVCTGKIRGMAQYVWKNVVKSGIIGGWNRILLKRFHLGLKVTTW